MKWAQQPGKPHVNEWQELLDLLAQTSKIGFQSVGAGRRSLKRACGLCPPSVVSLQRKEII